MPDLLNATLEIPYLLLMALIVVIGLLSWVIVWSREGRLDDRDRKIGEAERPSPEKRNCQDSI